MQAARGASITSFPRVVVTITHDDGGGHTTHLLLCVDHFLACALVLFFSLLATSHKSVSNLVVPILLPFWHVFAHTFSLFVYRMPT